MATNNDLSRKILSENYEPQLKDFIAEFYKDRVDDVSSLKLALEDQERSKIAALAHNWKGYAKPYGFNYLGELGAEIESLAKTENFEAEDFEKIRELVHIVEDYLKLKAEQFEL